MNSDKIASIKKSVLDGNFSEEKINSLLNEISFLKKELLKHKSDFQENTFQENIEILKQSEKTLKEYRKKNKKTHERRVITSFLPNSSTITSTQKFNILDWFINEISRFMLFHSFYHVETADLDSELHVFEKLGIKEGHSSRSKRDTFFIKQDINMVLRTQTTVMNTHFLHLSNEYLKRGAFKIFSVGTVYRRDDDATHLPAFHQIDLMSMKSGASVSELFSFLSDMISFLLSRLQHLLGKENKQAKIRFRPHFFPYTSPSFEMDISSGDDIWLELLGCGMLKKDIIQQNSSAKVYDAMAAGMGVERTLLMLLKLLGHNDISIHGLYE